MTPKQYPERRFHKRFKVSNNAVAFSHGTAGHILEISTGGLSAVFYGKDLTPKIDIPIDMTLSDQNYTVRSLPMSMLWVRPCKEHPVNSIPVHMAGIQFKNLTAFQISQIETFIQLQVFNPWP